MDINHTSKQGKVVFSLVNKTYKTTGSARGLVCNKDCTIIVVEAKEVIYK